jgi:succinate dehydrogenase / fumarate reductase iron-sulfur subunit
MVINGMPHGPEKATTTCQLHMRKFRTGDTIWIEPFRARAFPVLKDLMVDRSAFDRIQQAGGFVTVRTGAPQDANALPIGKDVADAAMDAAACIGCGACVAACKNASAMLFVSAKAGQLNSLPQGQPEKTRRTLGMVRAMDAAGFGNCTNQYECEAACPKEIKREWIGKLNRDYAVAAVKEAVVGLGSNASGGE